MKLRFRLLLLAALIVMVVAGNVAAREEIKPQDGGESTDMEADGEKSKKQKDDIQIDSGKVRVKQKWQRYKPPSSKKAKKAALRKEKALAKSGKEKWKAVAEKVRDKQTKRSARHVKQDTTGKQKWTKVDKSWKESKENKNLQADRRQLSGESKKLNKDKIRQESKMKEKQDRKDKQKLNQDSSVCKKDDLCFSGSDGSLDSEKNKWKRKNSGDVGKKEKSAQLNKAGDENPSDGNESVVANDVLEVERDINTEEGKQANALQQRTTEDIKPVAKPKGRKSEVSPSKLKGTKVDNQEDPDGVLEDVGEQSREGIGKNSSGNRKVKRSYIVEEEYDPECTSCSDRETTDDAGEAESSNQNTVRSIGGQSRIRRYIVEEEIMEEGTSEEQEAIGRDDMPALME